MVGLSYAKKKFRGTSGENFNLPVGHWRKFTGGECLVRAIAKHDSTDHTYADTLATSGTRYEVHFKNCPYAILHTRDHISLKH